MYLRIYIYFVQNQNVIQLKLAGSYMYMQYYTYYVTLGTENKLHVLELGEHKFI